MGKNLKVASEVEVIELKIEALGDQIVLNPTSEGVSYSKSDIRLCHKRSIFWNNPLKVKQYLNVKIKCNCKRRFIDERKPNQFYRDDDSLYSRYSLKICKPQNFQ